MRGSVLFARGRIPAIPISTQDAIGADRNIEPRMGFRYHFLFRLICDRNPMIKLNYFQLFWTWCVDHE